MKSVYTIYRNSAYFSIAIFYFLLGWAVLNFGKL